MWRLRWSDPVAWGHRQLVCGQLQWTHDSGPSDVRKTVETCNLNSLPWAPQAGALVPYYPDIRHPFVSVPYLFSLSVTSCSILYFLVSNFKSYISLLIIWVSVLCGMSYRFELYLELAQPPDSYPLRSSAIVGFLSSPVSKYLSLQPTSLCSLSLI